MIIQQKICGIDVLCEKSFIGARKVVEGAEIIGVRRRGKCLLIDLDNKQTMMIHLRMTGQIIYREKGIEGVTDEELLKKSFAGGHPTDAFFEKLPNKQTRVVFELSDGKLFFNDQRKFGFVKILPTAEVEQDKFIASLADEPWEMAVDDLYVKLQRHKKAPIKAVILDQKIIAGLGNIYADEALFEIGVHPETLAGNFDYAKTSELIEAAKKVMEASINEGGSTMATYVKADGTKGDYLENFAQVFHREGKECLRCGAKIIKIRVAGRGTHVCLHCQKKLSSKARKNARAVKNVGAVKKIKRRGEND